MILLKNLLCFDIIDFNTKKGGSNMISENFITFLKNDQTRIIAAKMLSQKENKVDAFCLSDYDVFSAFCDFYLLLTGHPIRTVLDGVFSANQIIPEPFKLPNSEYKKAIWKKIFSFEANVFDPALYVKDNCLPKVGSKCDKEEFFYLNNEIVSGYSDVFSLLEYIIEKISKENKSIIYCDLSAIEYANTDDYHANIAYGKLKNGENLSAELLLWLICRILMRLPVSLYLKTDSSEKAKQVINLIYARRISSRIYLSFLVEKRKEIENIFEFYLENNKKNISLDFYFSKEISSQKATEILAEIYGVIPFGLIKPSAVDCNIGLYREALNNWLSSIVICQKEKDFLLNYY